MDPASMSIDQLKQIGWDQQEELTRISENLKVIRAEIQRKESVTRQEAYEAQRAKEKAERVADKIMDKQPNENNETPQEPVVDSAEAPAKKSKKAK